MDQYYFSVNLEGGRTLCLAPISDRLLELSGQDVPDPSGYFLFEKSGSGELANVEIIAQAISEEAAFRLREMLKMA